MSTQEKIPQYPVERKEAPTFYFVGVTTGQSSIMKIFPKWMEALGRPDVVIEGVDHALNDDPERYRRTVAQIKYDPLSLGALVTSHKLNLARATGDMFDDLDAYARLTGEISCIAKHDGKLIGYAKDPITGGASLDAITGRGYFGRTGGHVLCLGAGGAGVALSLHLSSHEDAADRPERMVVVDRAQARLDELRSLLDEIETPIDFQLICNEDPRRNDAIMQALPDGSLVINATGMGKDIPGSPITDDGLFPRKGIAWELNYRGDLDFWHQAMAQRRSRNLRVESGWIYFLHGWIEHISEVLSIEIDDATFHRLTQLAEDVRPRLVFTPPRG